MSNWTRTPRVSAEQQHINAVRKIERQKMLKLAFNVGDDAFWVPHRNRPTPARKHSPRSNVRVGMVSRLSASVFA